MPRRGERTIYPRKALEASNAPLPPVNEICGGEIDNGTTASHWWMGQSLTMTPGKFK